MFIDLVWYFIIISFLGWVFCEIRGLLSEKKLYYEGFMATPFCPIYGVGSVLCYVLMNPFSENIYILIFGSTVLLSLFTVLFGVISEKLLGFKLWDFTDLKFNIGSYITVPFVLLLGAVGAIVVRGIIPVINSFISYIDPTVSLIISLSTLGVILIDYVLSLTVTIKLIHKIKHLNKISLVMDSDVSVERLKEFEANYNRVFTDSIIRRHLINSFPELKKTSMVKQITDKLEEIKTDNMKEYTQSFSSNEEKPFAFGICFTKLFYLFVIGSFLGTIFETVWALFAEGHFELRVGMVYGPFIPVYGGGACFLTIALYKLYKLSDTLIFLISAVVGAGFEYFCSWFQETMFGTVSWDYSDTPFNLDGRTNLMYALIWGLLGLVWVRYLYPLAAKLIEKIPKRTGVIITAFLLLFMIYNSAISIYATQRWTNRSDGVPAQNRFEEYLDRSFDDKRMEMLFPHMKDVETTGVTSEGIIKIDSEKNK